MTKEELFEILKKLLNRNTKLVYSAESKMLKVYIFGKLKKTIEKNSINELNKFQL